MSRPPRHTASPLRLAVETLAVLAACGGVGLVVGAMIGFVGLWEASLSQRALFALPAAVVGGVIASVEGGLLYLITKKYLAFRDYRLVALISLFGGTTAAVLCSVLSEGLGLLAGLVVTPLVTFITTCVVMGERTHAAGGP